MKKTFMGVRLRTLRMERGLTQMALAQPLRAALDADRQPAQPLALQALFKPIGMVLGHPSLRALAACSFLFSAVQVSTTAYMVTYLNESLGMTLLAAGAPLSVSQLAGVVGRIAWGAVADRGVGPRNTLMLLATLLEPLGVHAGILGFLRGVAAGRMAGD